MDLSFRDQTAELAGKHKTKNISGLTPDSIAGKSVSNEAMSNNSSISFEEEELYDAWGTDVIVPSLLPSMESQAMCYFFRNYVLEDYSHSKGYFDYLAHIYNT